MTFHRASDQHYMRLALDEARLAADAGEVPVGAIVVRGDQVIARGHNRTVRDQDPTAHAETIVLREASRVAGAWRLDGCTMYVTLEPCAMCAGAAVLARLDRVVFGAWDERVGMAGSVVDLLRHPRLNHQLEVQGGVLGDEAGALLKEFFSARRKMPPPSGPDFVDTLRVPG